MTERPFTLAVVSHGVNYRHQGQLYTYGPYAREIEIWADLFPRMVIAAPLREEPPPADCLALVHSNIEVVPLLETGGGSLWHKLLQILSLPSHAWKLSKLLSQVDAIHVRCPGNIGLLGALLAPLFSDRIVTKYAGQWIGDQSIPFTYRLQRQILSSFWWRKGLVTVYGEWPDQPKQVIPFFTSMMTTQQIERAAPPAGAKTLDTPLRVMYSGRLVPLKGVDVLIRAAAEANLPLEVSIVGDGPERANLEALAKQLKVDDRIQFVGALPFDDVMACYQRAHVLVLASNTEGWPKVITEAMCHGVVCIATDQGLLPWMLKDRGVTVPVSDHHALAVALRELASDPERYQKLSGDSASWARRYSLEGLREALANLMSRSWNIRLAPAPAERPTSMEVL